MWTAVCKPNISSSDDRIHVDPDKFRKRCPCQPVVFRMHAPVQLERLGISGAIAL